MNHHLAPPRRPRAVALLLAPLVLLAISGCSVLGIATKGDVRRAEADMDAINRNLTAQSQRLTDEINDVARDLASLTTRLASAEGDIRDLEDVTGEVDALTERLEVTRQELTILGGRLNRDLEVVRSDLDTASERAQAAQEFAQSADARGQQITDSYLNNLRIERKRLRAQLDQIEDLLADWSRLSTEAMASSSEGAEGTVEIRRR